MRETLPGPEVEKHCKGGLNGTANPSEHLTDGDQFFLGNTEEKCRQGAHYIASRARESMRTNGFSLSTLGSMVGKDATAAHRVLDVEQPSIALQVLAAVLILDRDHAFLRGLARATGCEVSERPALTDAEFRRRVEAHAHQSRIGAAWLEEALGEDAP